MRLTLTRSLRSDVQSVLRRYLLTMFSATDIAKFLACQHIMSLDREEAEGKIRKPFFPDPGIELLRKLGLQHEQAYLQSFATQPAADRRDSHGHITNRGCRQDARSTAQGCCRCLSRRVSGGVLEGSSRLSCARRHAQHPRRLVLRGGRN